MELYFSPLACSMATRIAFHEAGVEARFVEVDGKTKRLPDGSDYRAVHPLGLVPALRGDDGTLVTENAAILQYVADHLPTGDLAPRDAKGRTELQQWLCFVGTELHKSLFTPLLDPHAPEGAKAYALEKGAARLAYLDRHLTGRATLLEAFSVADAYLVTVLNWTAATPVSLAPYPAIAAYVEGLRQRPSVARALGDEIPLYRAELARRSAA